MKAALALRAAHAFVCVGMLLVLPMAARAEPVAASKPKFHVVDNNFNYEVAGPWSASLPQLCQAIKDRFDNAVHNVDFVSLTCPGTQVECPGTGDLPPRSPRTDASQVSRWLSVRTNTAYCKEYNTSGSVCLVPACRPDPHEADVPKQYRVVGFCGTEGRAPTYDIPPPPNSPQPTCMCPAGTEWLVSESRCTAMALLPRASVPPPPECEACVGNPIYPLRGVKREVVDTGLAIGNTTLRLSYDSGGKAVQSPANLADRESLVWSGVLGSRLWFSNLHRSAKLPLDGAAPEVLQSAIFDRGNGALKTMTRMGQGGYAGEPGSRDRFDADTRVYRDGTENTQETYTQGGRLTGISWADGVAIGFIHDSGGLLIQVTDNRGRRLRFGYEGPGAGEAARLSTVTAADGGTLTLAYDAQGNLARLTWADGTVRQLRYEKAELPWALTGVVDEQGRRYATFSYDESGRATSTEHAGGADRFSVTWDSPPVVQVAEQAVGPVVQRSYDWSAPLGVVVTGPLGQATRWTAVNINGKNQFSAQTQQAGAGSLASSRSQGYDANGGVVSRDDFNGMRSCYSNDDVRKLEVVRVEGLGLAARCADVTMANASLPAGGRKISTRWHPDWSLPTQQAAPGQVTTWVYNGQPDPFAGNAIASCASTAAMLPDGKPIAVLCKQVEQATTDGDGHLGFSASLQAGPPIRIRTWTYNERGQVLTAKGTRSSDTTTYTYHATTDANHTVGDLATMTDASGKTTTYDRYNKLGQLLQSTDADGVVTLRTYDARQRLLTSTMDTETTTYTYDRVGQLTQVTQPDGRWIGYEYDEAHRQTAVKDSRGNRIEYQLDNAGKQIGQTVKDPTGSLKRSLARVMDALGRVQQGSGRE